jgi:sigma-54 dependent transcriptional regulator, acetoin dehydrogenase operon transcriptional activator AcoR
VLRVGGDTYIPVDVRILAASNQPLEKLVEQGRFRADLYHRISTCCWKTDRSSKASTSRRR